MTPSVRRPPTWRLYLYMLAPSVVIVILVGALAIGSVKVLGAVRAYVGGESLWSKSRNEAVQHLLVYANTSDPMEYALFEQALKVPQGDRRAREGMMHATLDWPTVRKAFIDGGNHPDDIDGMIELFRHFGDEALFKDSLDAWIEGDRLIARLQELALQLRDQIRREASDDEVKATLNQIRSINKALFNAEIAFSRNLGHASRVTEQMLIGSVTLAAVALSLIGYLVIRRGLKRQQLYQQDIARAHRRWELAVVGAELGLFEVDADGAEVMLDAQAAALYGLPQVAVTLTGPELLQRMAPEDRRRADQAFRDAVTNHSVFRLTVRVPLPGGQNRYLETLGSLPDNGDDSDEVQRVIGVIRDVTQEKARAQLALERDAAERVAISQRGFLSRLSHELRTPLNAILGFAQLLTMDHLHPLPPTQHKQVEWIFDAGQQLLKLVEDVLDLSKVEAGEIGITLQDCDLGTVLDSSLILIESARVQHKVTIVKRLAQPAPKVVADPQRLQQVLVNLLTNGCKYNRPGGQVTVEAREVASRVLIDVTDNGIGLTQQDAEALFQPFRRVAAVSGKVEGSGLGLYIVKQLVERMGGKVSVHSEPGKGSRFSVELPKAA